MAFLTTNGTVAFGFSLSNAFATARKLPAKAHARKSTGCHRQAVSCQIKVRHVGVGLCFILTIEVVRFSFKLIRRLFAFIFMRLFHRALLLVSLVTLGNLSEIGGANKGVGRARLA